MSHKLRVIMSHNYLDIYSRRNGQRPNDKMVKVLTDTVEKVMTSSMSNLKSYMTHII